MFQQKEEAYLPMGPAESARIRAAAEEKLSELFQTSQLLQEKSAFLAWTNSITNDLIGVGSKKSGSKNNSPTNHPSQHSPSSSSSSSSSLYAIPEMTNDMKYPSFTSLDKLRSLRENVSNAMGIEDNEDANVPYEPYLDARRRHHQAQQQVQFQSEYRPSIPMEGEISSVQRKERAVSFDERILKAEDNVAEEDDDEGEDAASNDEDELEDDEDEEVVEGEGDDENEDENMQASNLDASMSIHHRSASSTDTEAMTTVTYNSRYPAEMTAAYKGSDMDANKSLISNDNDTSAVPIDSAISNGLSQTTQTARKTSTTTSMSTTFEPQFTTTLTSSDATDPLLGTQPARSPQKPANTTTETPPTSAIAFSSQTATIPSMTTSVQETTNIISTLPPVSSDAAIDMDDSSSSLLPPPQPSVSISASFATLSNTQPLQSLRGGQGLDLGKNKEMNDSSCSGGQSTGEISADYEASKRLSSSPYRHANIQHNHHHPPLSKDQVLRVGEDVRGLGFDVDFSGSWRSSSSCEGITNKHPSPFTHTRSDKDHKTIFIHREPQRSLVPEDNDLSLRVIGGHDDSSSLFIVDENEPYPRQPSSPPRKHGNHNLPYSFDHHNHNHAKNNSNSIKSKGLVFDEQEYTRARANYQSILSETFEDQERWDAPPGGSSGTRVLYGQNKYNPISMNGVSSSEQGHLLRPSPHPYYDPSVGTNSSVGTSLLHEKGNKERDGEIFGGGVRAQTANDLDRMFTRGTLRDGDRIDVTRSAPTFTIGSDRISATRSLRETVDLSNMTYQRMKDITGHY